MLNPIYPLVETEKFPSISLELGEALRRRDSLSKQAIGHAFRCYDRDGANYLSTFIRIENNFLPSLDSDSLLESPTIKLSSRLRNIKLASQKANTHWLDYIGNNFLPYNDIVDVYARMHRLPPEWNPANLRNQTERAESEKVMWQFFDRDWEKVFVTTGMLYLPDNGNRRQQLKRPVIVSLYKTNAFNEELEGEDLRKASINSTKNIMNSFGINETTVLNYARSLGIDLNYHAQINFNILNGFAIRFIYDHGILCAESLLVYDSNIFQLLDLLENQDTTAMHVVEEQSTLLEDILENIRDIKTLNSREDHFR